LDYNQRDGIDLHIHSSASDGTFSPGEIIETACAHNLRAIAITDHDSIDGSKQALKAGIPDTLKFLTGVELSTAPPPILPLSGSFHILGYGIDLDNLDLNRALKLLQKARANRNPAIIDRLNQLGFDITLDRLAVSDGNDQIGRPHIARAMLQKGYVSSIDDAFDRFLGHDCPAYVDKPRISCQQAINIIREAGGIAVLAHPYLLNLTDQKHMDNLISTLKKMGIGGIEVYYPEHSPQATAFYEVLARKYNLLMTGGTDFHGKLKPEIQMGSGTGRLFVPFALYEKLYAALSHHNVRSE
jgi:predicted metal-dependent phosphoesterase TrpH